MIWPSGRWQWWDGWAVVGLWSLYGVIIMWYLMTHDPELLAEKMRLLPLHQDHKAWGRHPMYTVVIVLLFAFPLALGSRYTLVLSVFLTLLLVVRTHFEDRTLHAELEGYPEYANRTPYRLVPGIW